MNKSEVFRLQYWTTSFNSMESFSSPGESWFLMVRCSTDEGRVRVETSSPKLKYKTSFFFTNGNFYIIK